MSKVTSVSALALSATAIDANIKSIQSRGKAFYALVHKTACAIIVQSAPHNMGGHLDCSRAQSLLAAMPGASRKNALKAWFGEFSNIRWNGDGKCGLLGPKDAGYAIPRPVEAHALPYWEFTPEPEVGAMDDVALSASLQAVLKRIANAKDAKKLGLSPATMSGLASLEHFAASVKKRADAVKAQAKIAKDNAKAAPAKAPAKRTAAKEVQAAA